MTTAAQLAAAEVLKSRHRPVERVATLTVIGLSIAAPVVAVLLAISQPAQYQKLAGMIVTFPWSLNSGLLVFGLAGSLLACAFVSSSFGTEYTLGTWRSTLPLHHRRATVVAVKLLVAWGHVLGIALAAIVLNVMLGFFLATYVAPTIPALAPGANALGFPFSLFIVTGLRLALDSAAAAAATVASRSALIGLGAGIAFPMVLRVLSIDAARSILPPAHLANVQARLMDTGVSLNTLGAGVPGTGALDVPMLVSLAVIAAYMGLLGALTAYLFARQEI